jgi:hypothetical protein
MRDKLTGNCRKLHNDILQMGEACGMYRKKRNSYRVLVGKLEERTWKTQA